MRRFSITRSLTGNLFFSTIAENGVGLRHINLMYLFFEILSKIYILLCSPSTFQSMLTIIPGTYCPANINYKFTGY
jgi:hypothetical protein